MKKDEILKAMKYSDEILEVIDNQDKYTRSDLQGIVDRIVEDIIRDTKAEIE